MRQARAWRPAVPFLRVDATGGLGAKRGGRSFGIELEYDLPLNRDLPPRERFPDLDRRSQQIGKDLFALGLTEDAFKRDRHARVGTSRWRYEIDVSTDNGGEVVSPVLHDQPKTWRQLEQVLTVLRRHGGTAGVRTGGHVHVGIGDYGNSLAKHGALLNLFEAFSEELYLLAADPARGTYRDGAHARPNRTTVETFASVEALVAKNSTHHEGLNFESVDGSKQSHVEFRLWDGSLDPGVIQARVKLSLAMGELASKPAAVERLILRAERVKSPQRRMALLLEALFQRPQDRRQAAALYASILRART